jgi:SPP1 family phage portal protein
MTSDELKELFDQHQKDVVTIRQNRAYVRGKNPTVLNQHPKREPDNRIPVAWAKMAVEDLTGYAGKFSVSWASMDDNPVDEEYLDRQRRVMDWNEWEQLITETYTTALSFGVAYLLVWGSDDLNLPGMLTPEFALCRNEEWILHYSDDMKPILMAAVRILDERTVHVYTSEMRQTWNNVQGTWTHRTEEDQQHLFGQVPLAVFPINYDRVPLFEAEKSLIDAHDQLISKSQNEIDRFNALIALFPGKIDRQFIEKLAEVKAIDDLGQYERWPEYLEKSLMNINDFYNNLADRLERLYHKSVKVPDFSDQNFGSNSSGIAMAFKLLGLEFKASTIEAYFEKGIVKLFDLINELFKKGIPSMDPTIYKMGIKSERRIPVDNLQAVQIAVQLKGLGVSDETILRMLPETIIGDVEAELERMIANVPEILI